ncbi:lytic transglycosylase domain-containing protein [Klebsiella oxytoca]|uniref:lytic transglycosylase domain-containing protein n=1 Tax=Klebsiella oxytoca TaxID=571 RepID=UPI00254C8695|nr:lytic transglycosylase domain-containing protein [Klebsiella oxytoca]MEC5509938.1 lytic transglycosylase domain-containing protein [Klebsiella oxytoca]
MSFSTTAIAGLILQCTSGVAPETVKAIIDVESGGNPWVIASVTDKKSFYLPDRAAAEAVAKELTDSGKNFSAGPMQINSSNFSAYGLDYHTVFEPCNNLKTGAAILKKCWSSASQYQDRKERLKASLSCYYSGNFTRGLIAKGGEKQSYVELIVNASERLSHDMVPSVRILSGEPDSSDKYESQTSSHVQQTKTKYFFTGEEITDGPVWDVFSDPNPASE